MSTDKLLNKDKLTEFIVFALNEEMETYSLLKKVVIK